MYWHKNIGTNDWQLRNNSKNQKIIKQIEPLLAGNAFSSAIHFRNLTAVELGALLKVFHLQQDDKEDIVYKLGMGKSLGMGSVRIQSVLHLDNDRYGQLFDGGKWKKPQNQQMSGILSKPLMLMSKNTSDLPKILSSVFEESSHHA